MPGKDASPPHEGEAALARIADLLGCDVAAFGEGSDAAVNAAETSELLQLWLAIANWDDRHKLLSLARSIAAM